MGHRGKNFFFWRARDGDLWPRLRALGINPTSARLLLKHLQPHPLFGVERYCIDERIPLFQRR